MDKAVVDFLIIFYLAELPIYRFFPHSGRVVLRLATPGSSPRPKCILMSYAVPSDSAHLFSSRIIFSS